jgi:cation:H+ antiporter
MVFGSLAAYILSFAAVFIGAGLIIKSVDRFSHKLKLSSFSVSFFILGILTSIPELAVGLTAVSEHKPEIFMGNLIGGVAVLFLLIIPLLAIFSNGVKLNEQLTDKNLIFSFLVMLAPLLAVLDRKATNLEGILMMGLYILLFFFIERQKGVFDNGHTEILHVRSYSYMDILKVLLGVVMVFIASNVIVSRTLYFANLFNISTFYISLVILSIGTNLPELSLAVRSIIWKKRDVALGDYLGSATANTFLFGLFIVLSPAKVLESGNYLLAFLLLDLGFILFYYFSRSKRDISRKEALILVCLYVVFVIAEKII